MKDKPDEFTREWITQKSVEICSQYEHGVLTLRGLHYQLVSVGMTNSVRHYKRVVGAMIKARREGVVEYAQFSDHDRETIGATEADGVDLAQEIERGKQQIQAWMTAYRRNRWENQDRFVEVWVEKKALQGIFQPVCEQFDVALCPCKGYPSLTFLHEASERFREAVHLREQIPTILYFGDHDPSGEDIPRSIRSNLENDFDIEVDVQLIALSEEQCIDLNLPPAPAKLTDSRTAGFTGLGQIELDAVKPEILREWISDAIADSFDEDIYQTLVEEGDAEREEYQTALREYVENL